MQVRSVLDVSRHHSGAQSENRTRDLRITKVGRGFRDLAFLAIYQVFSDQVTSPSPANSVQFRPISWLRSWLASRPGRSVRAGGSDVILPTDRHRVTLPGGRGSAALVLCVCIKLPLRSMAGSHRPDGRFVAVIIEHCTWAVPEWPPVGGVEFEHDRSHAGKSEELVGLSPLVKVGTGLFGQDSNRTSTPQSRSACAPSGVQHLLKNPRGCRKREIQRPRSRP